MQEMAHIANGRDPGNCVSLLRVNVSFKLFLSKSSVRGGICFRPH